MSAPDEIDAPPVAHTLPYVGGMGGPGDGYTQIVTMFLLWAMTSGFSDQLQRLDAQATRFAADLVHSTGTRAAGYGQALLGHTLDTQTTVEEVTFRLGTPNAVGDTVIRVIYEDLAGDRWYSPGTDITIPAGEKSASRTLGLWLDAGYRLLVYIVDAGAEPGAGLAGWFTGRQQLWRRPETMLMRTVTEPEVDTEPVLHED